MFSRKWWGKTLERMIKTAAQTYIGVYGTDKLLLDIPWNVMWQMIVGMTLLSLATSILTTKLGPDGDDPSAI